MATEKWLSPKMIAAQYSISEATARRWILRIYGDDTHTAGRKKEPGKRPYRMRRVPESLLKKHLDEFLNG